MVIDLVLLGTGAMAPLPGRPLSSLMARAGGSLVLFDCGEGTQVEIRRAHWGFRRLDAICLTHHHADHVAGLPGLLHTVAHAGRTEPMHLFGPAGTIALFEGLRVLVPWLPYDVVVQEFAGGESFALPGGMRGKVAAVEHRVTCLAYRVDVDRTPAFDPARAEALGAPRTAWSRLQRGEAVEVAGRLVRPEEVLGPPRKGAAFAFVTDTRATAAVEALAQGVDLLVSEATYALDEDAEKAARHGHMTLRQACAQAASAGVGALWLTHFGGRIENPQALEATAQAIFPGTTMGYPGLTCRITFDTGYVAMGV